MAFSIVAVVDEKIAELEAHGVRPRFIVMATNALTALVREITGTVGVHVDLDRMRQDGSWTYKGIEIVACNPFTRFDPFQVLGAVTDEIALFQIQASAPPSAKS